MATETWRYSLIGLSHIYEVVALGHPVKIRPHVTDLLSGQEHILRNTGLSSEAGSQIVEGLNGPLRVALRAWQRILTACPVATSPNAD